MKPKKLVLLLAAIAVVALCGLRMTAADTAAPARYEYATIRWAGKENTHIIRPGGQVEFAGAELRKAQKPDRADDHAFYMNLSKAVNHSAQLNNRMKLKPKKIACLFTIAIATQGCLVNRIMDSQDRNHYSEYLSQVSKNNIEREKAGLQPEKPLTYEQWAGKK